MMFATPEKNWNGWDYMMGKGEINLSQWRYDRLVDLTRMSERGIKIAFHDPESGAWTRWVSFWDSQSICERKWISGYGNWSVWRDVGGFNNAWDIHRSLLENEILVESDYPTYEENFQATRIIGGILESKGFQPMYYYSGNKSIHIHILFDFKCLLTIDMELQEKILLLFKTRYLFNKEFIKYLRTLFISCWGTQARSFDKDLIKSRHLIRSELSRNKQGFKTFLGYTYKDISFVPYVCNEENRIYPEIGELRLSSPNDPQELIEEFLVQRERGMTKARRRRREASLMNYIDPDRKKAIKPCVKLILSNDFKEIGDGFNRAIFILSNELRPKIGDEATQITLHDWNERMGSPLRDREIDNRFKSNKMYTISCFHVHEFLRNIGIKDIDCR